METAKRLSSKSRIIFITSYREYAVDAFEVEAVHYLLKPVTDERLYQAMDRALNRSKQEDDRTMALIKSGSTLGPVGIEHHLGDQPVLFITEPSISLAPFLV